MRELPAYGRPDLCQLLGRAEPVEPRHQRCVQACGDCPGLGRNGSNRLLGRALALSLQHRLGYLLDKQRDAIAALDDVLTDARRKELIANDPIYHGADFSLRQPIESEGGHVRLPDPGRLELWSEG